MTTDKTSTAPEFSLQELADSIRGHLCDDDRPTLSTLRHWLSAIDAHLNAPTTDVVGGDVVAFRFIRADGHKYTWVDASEMARNGRPEDVLAEGERIEYAYAAPRVQGEIIAWVTPEGDRSISASQKAQGERDGGASATSVRPFSVPAYAGSRVQGDADGTLRAACQRFRAAELDWKAARSEHREASQKIDSAFCVRGDRLDVAEKALRTAVAAKHEAKRSLFAALAAQPKGDADQCQVRKDNQGLDESGRLAPLSPEQTRGDGVAAMPASFLISKKALEGIHYMCGGDEDGAEIDDRWCEGMAWIGHLDNGDGTSSYGLHLHNADYPEEGSITIAQFVERDAPRQAVPEFTRTKPLVPGYYLVRGYTWPYEGEAYDKQAAVEVRQRDDGLVVNLHEKNSDEDMDRWYLVETIDSNFEWAMLAAAPLAGRMGVDRG